MPAFSRLIGVSPRWQRLGAALALVVAVLGVLGAPAAAQTLSDAERAQLQARKETLFQQSLREPGNLDVAFAYADASAKLGDNEAAVSALQRMLLFNPNLPRVKLELGALFFRMGSYELARTYFEQTLASNPPQEVKTRIETYLAEIARFSAPQRFSGFFFFGGQYQSDANVAPGSPLVHSPIGDVLLNSQFIKKSDVNVFATGAFLYSYDLGTQDRDTFEVGGTGFANHYSSVTRLDLGLTELTTGPRVNFLKPLPDIESASLKPYLITNDVSLGGNQYFHTFGVGAEATLLAWHDIRFRSVFEFRDKNFNNAPDRPLSRALTGTDKLLTLFVSKPVTTTPFFSELALEFDYLNQDTRKIPTIFGLSDYYSNQTYAAAAAYRVRYDDPTGTFAFPWETTGFFSHSWADYDAPDPCCTGLTPTIRHDRHFRFGVTQSVQVADNVAVVLQLQRDIVSSNLSLYGYTSNSVLLGPQIRF